MVDIGSKPVVAREAVAHWILLILSETAIDVVANGRSPKGDVRQASTIAAIQAVKELSNTTSLPSNSIEGCDVDWKIEEKSLRCTVTVRTHWTTGVEMEALCGVSAALLCAWDMLKPIEKDSNGQYPNSQIEGIRVLRKSKSDPHD